MKPTDAALCVNSKQHSSRKRFGYLGIRKESLFIQQTQRQMHSTGMLLIESNEPLDISILVAKNLMSFIRLPCLVLPRH